jgi:bifunctional non-homologous end joining protein LigD
VGLRDDKTPAECVREAPAAPPAAPPGPPATATRRRTPATAASRAPVEVTLTHPDRLLYPRDGITKRDVADYYEAVAGPMLRALADRPLALEHWNDGIDAPSWFQQNIGKDAPPWMRLEETPTRTSRRRVRHLIADRPEALRWLAQHSVLAVHMWSSRSGSLESPDWVIFDLDPDARRGIAQAVAAALVLRNFFERLSLPSVPKTSGKRGLHLLVPLAAGHTHEQAVEFAVWVTTRVAELMTDVTVERSPAKRRGRLYLDAYQNGYGKTIVAPYSLRALDGAPVSAPLAWSEVTPKLDPARLTLRTMPKRLATVGDLFERALGDGVRLPPVR